MRNKLERRLARIMARKPLELKPGVAKVAITFDDVPRTACDIGSQIVCDAGGRATYYVSGGFEQGPEADRFHRGQDLVRLHEAGHEIGCHGFNHLNYQHLTRAEIADDIAQNQAYFQHLGLPPAETFAYPYGCVSPSVKRTCGTFYDVSRGITAGVNSGTSDAHLLMAAPLYSGSWSVDQSRALLGKAAAQGGLVVFFTHGVETEPSQFDCTPELLAQTLKIAGEMGIEILPLNKAVKALSAGR